MHLDERKTYRTRDGSRTGIRVRRRYEWGSDEWPWTATAGVWKCNDNLWTKSGRLYDTFESSGDLVEEQPADRPFSYDACPVGTDGRRRAVTRDGREVVLLCDDALGEYPIIGWMLDELRAVVRWRLDGVCWNGNTDLDLVVPPPPKRVVWVNLYDLSDRQDGTCLTAYAYATRELADNGVRVARLGDRAHPIEIDQ